MTTTPSKPAGIDPRGPRFGAAITAVLLLATLFIALVRPWLYAAPLLAVIVALFAWGAFAGIQRHPYGKLFARFIQPRLVPPTELEDPRPPTFAQLVGFIITGLGLLIGVAVAPIAIPISAALAFVAAFLNAVFGYCLGCQIYLLLVRARIIRSAG